MSPLSTIRTVASQLGEARRRRHTRRVIEALPENIRRDIGWRR
jgi:hypothetical protein